MTPVGVSPAMAAIGIALGLFLSLICYLTTSLSPGGVITSRPAGHRCVSVMSTFSRSR